MKGVVFWARDVGDDWVEISAELARAFEVSREAAQGGRSLVYVVHEDDLLGRRGPGNAMVATGLLSAARTAAIEGARKGWTINVIAFDEGAAMSEAEEWSNRLILSGAITGELLRIGPGHIGKALS
ncbi:MAG: hypothetical protein WBZ45_03365 [Acidimicrobiia bacterium]